MHPCSISMLEPILNDFPLPFLLCLRLLHLWTGLQVFGFYFIKTLHYVFLYTVVVQYGTHISLIQRGYSWFWGRSTSHLNWRWMVAWLYWVLVEWVGRGIQGLILGTRNQRECLLCQLLLLFLHLEVFVASSEHLADVGAGRAAGIWVLGWSGFHWFLFGILR